MYAGLNRRQSRKRGTGSMNFGTIPSVSVQRSQVDLSHGHTTTFDSGYLVPICKFDALPGDTFNLRTNIFARLTTPLRPFMHNVLMDIFFFAVPYRLVWDNWQKLCGEQTNPGDSTDFQVPIVTPPAGGWGELSMADFFGIPTKVDNIATSALPFRAMHLIYNEWFRPQDIIDSLTVETGDGPDADTLYRNYGPASDEPLFRRAKRHDYFTSCQPWPQKGPAATLPLGISAPVAISSSGDGEPVFGAGATTAKIQADASAPHQVEYLTDPSGDQTLSWSDPKLAGTADLTAATAATIEELRQSIAIQRLFEKDSRGGTRYTEQILHHFGVESPDQRLQRPEYLGGGRIPLNVHPIVQTSFTSPNYPFGLTGGFATANGQGMGFVKSFTEHCVIIGLANVRADLVYQQGLSRHWSKRDRFEFYWPELANLGEQEVLNQEIYAQGDGPTNDEVVFGYQERWSEYRHEASKVTGRMRSNAAQSTEIWHLAQEFDSLPGLNEEFIQEDPPIDRVISVVTEPQFYFDAWFNVRAARPMPLRSVPGLTRF